jgi:hypothetical protein
MAIWMHEAPFKAATLSSEAFSAVEGGGANCFTMQASVISHNIAPKQMKACWYVTEWWHHLKTKAAVVRLPPPLQQPAERVAILVLSGRANAARRTAIRQTWGHEHANVHFIVGGETCGIPTAHRKPYNCEHANSTNSSAPAIPASDQDAHDRSIAAEDRALELEAATHGDLVIMPGLEDSYRGLPAKLKRAYRWALLHTNARWFLKIDDDSYVRVQQIETQAAAWADTAGVYTMHAAAFDQADVSRVGKWAETKYVPDKYPPYPRGAGHAINRALATYVVDNAETLVEYQGEDTSMAIWMHEAPFKAATLSSGAFSANSNCLTTRASVISHDIAPKQMQACWDATEKQHHSARLGESPFWFDTPAADWSSEIPIGNGKLGALVSGEPFCEVVHLSEDTMWAGRHASKPTPDSVNKRDPKHFAAFERAREAVLKEDWEGAEQATNTMVVDGISGFSYLGELWLTSAATNGKYEGFKRDLNLETAITSSTFQSQAVSHSREAFVSAADQVMVMQFSQDAGPLQIDVEMTSTHHVSSTGSSAGNLNVTTMTKKEDGGLVFTVCAAVLPSSNIINAVEAEGKLRITGSGRSSFTLALAAATSYGEHRDTRC